MKTHLIATTILLTSLMTPVAAEDTRIPVYLAADQHAVILTEMRGFLEGINGIMGAISRQDMAAVTDTARRYGSQQMRQHRLANGEAGPGFDAPQPFRTMAQILHDSFDQMALDAEQMGDPQLTFEQLTTATATCTACHLSYRLVVK